MPVAWAEHPYQQAGFVVDLADTVFLTVPDDVIGSVAEACVARWHGGRPLLRAHTVSVEAPGYGAVTGGFHPLYTFPQDSLRTTTLENVTFAIESQDPALHHQLRDMAHALHGHAIDVNEKSRALYHISGVFASNYLIAIISEAAGLWAQFGYNQSQALRALLPLIRGTVGNIERDGGLRVDRPDSQGIPRDRAGAP